MSAACTDLHWLSNCATEGLKSIVEGAYMRVAESFGAVAEHASGPAHEGLPEPPHFNPTKP